MKIIKKIFYLFLILFFVYKFFFYVDISNGCFVRFKPSFMEFNTGNIKDAIAVLKNAVPQEYQKFCGNVSKINPNIACGGFGGGCFYGTEREIYLWTSHGSFVGWTAAIIAHETCHVVQDLEERTMEEGECYKIGNEVLKSIVEY
ncbi:hypothetical protein A2442_03480 [Candidatus Campbellbacteria bacterium RIFOXYC2_FULL_35_25]|uniref:Uncharacterized protein n=1 Tax=Candidatus Campbellbacteria bacterium RIFOXYC2_FULL_35_25 TaxID=1797582 RepID=A0A1F5EHN9_9BACT|nr:MAG: hypothetical protein A2442_03480 [Candidatus Campbellbacteria bacterium RIFOXYC2_FULL_35_25]